MKHTIAIETTIKPFDVPDHVLHEPAPRSRKDGFVPAPKIPLSELSEETLEALCSQFREAVFRKAGKQPPLPTHLIRRAA